jgi:hypothetical protein
MLRSETEGETGVAISDIAGDINEVYRMPQKSFR